MGECPAVALGTPVALLAIDELDFAFTGLGRRRSGCHVTRSVLGLVVVGLLGSGPSWIVSSRLVLGVERLVRLLLEPDGFVAVRVVRRLNQGVDQVLQLRSSCLVDSSVVLVHGRLVLDVLSCGPLAVVVQRPVLFLGDLEHGLHVEFSVNHSFVSGGVVHVTNEEELFFEFDLNSA